MKAEGKGTDSGYRRLPVCFVVQSQARSHRSICIKTFLQLFSPDLGESQLVSKVSIPNNHQTDSNYSNGVKSARASATLRYDSRESNSGQLNYLEFHWMASGFRLLNLHPWDQRWMKLANPKPWSRTRKRTQIVATDSRRQYDRLKAPSTQIVNSAWWICLQFACLRLIACHASHSIRPHRVSWRTTIKAMRTFSN